jgi:outer membrane protein assembly factor BamA
MPFLAQPAGNDSRPDTLQEALPDSLIAIGNITITGNKKTRPEIILREIPLKSGEEYTLKEVLKKMEDARGN